MSLETKQDVLAMFPHARICDNYGLTESNRSTSLELHDTAHLDSIGKPIADSVCVKVIDGEICVQGRQTMVGYWDAEDNEGAFVDGFVRTGDCGYVSEDGYVYLTGRMKEMINQTAGTVLFCLKSGIKQRGRFLRPFGSKRHPSGCRALFCLKKRPIDIPQGGAYSDGLKKGEH
jgi:acyl-CoA synthetase (AMP-forming)/AMP-acid ligase II